MPYSCSNDNIPLLATSTGCAYYFFSHIEPLFCVWLWPAPYLGIKMNSDQHDFFLWKSCQCSKIQRLPPDNLTSDIVCFNHLRHSLIRVFQQLIILTRSFSNRSRHLSFFLDHISLPHSSVSHLYKSPSILNPNRCYFAYFFSWSVLIIRPKREKKLSRRKKMLTEVNWSAHNLIIKTMFLGLKQIY